MFDKKVKIFAISFSGINPPIIFGINRILLLFMRLIFCKGSEKMKELIEKLMSITDDMTIEQVRPILADIIEQAQKVQDDFTALQTSIDDLTQKNDEAAEQIKNLQEENGRLYRDRVHEIVKKDEEETDDTSVEEEIEKLESEIEL